MTLSQNKSVQKKLTQENLSKITKIATIVTPKYDRENTEIGIVHLGPGALIHLINGVLS